MIVKLHDQSFGVLHSRQYCSPRLIGGLKCPSYRGTQSTTLLLDNPVPVDVIGPSDIVSGTAIALLLAFTASFLQGRRNGDDFAPSELPNTNMTSPTFGAGDDESRLMKKNVFDADAWKDISKPESYVFYNQKLKRKESKSSSFNSENAWVLVALLGLFVPIFSVEFFFALSRQLICGGNPLEQSEWSAYLCSPAMERI